MADSAPIMPERIYFVGRAVDVVLNDTFSSIPCTLLSKYGMYEIQPFGMSKTIQDSQTPISKQGSEVKGRVFEIAKGGDDYAIPGNVKYTTQELHTSLKAVPEKLVQTIQKGLQMWAYLPIHNNILRCLFPATRIAKSYEATSTTNLKVVCEEISGEIITLKDLIDSKAFLIDIPENNTKSVLNTLIQIANALAFLEDQQVLHCGLIPEAFIWVEETRTIKLSGFYFAKTRPHTHHGFKARRKGGFMDFLTKEEQAEFKSHCEKKHYTNNIRSEIRVTLSRHCDLYAFGLIALQMCGISPCSLSESGSTFMKGLVQGVINIAEMCGVNNTKASVTANFVLYRLLGLYKKIFGDSNARLWQPISFPTEVHKLNCLGIARYLNGDVRNAKKDWKSATKTDPGCVHALYNLALLNPFKVDYYLDLLEKAPVTPERERLLAQCYFKKGFLFPSCRRLLRLLEEDLEPFTPPIQSLSSLSQNQTTVHKVYCTETEDHSIFVYCTYTNQPKISLWMVKNSKFKKWQAISVDTPEGLCTSFNACALSKNTKHLCVTVSTMIYVYLLSKTAAITSFKLVGHTHETVAVSISADSRLCASSEKGPSVRVHDLKTGIPLALLSVNDFSGEIARVNSLSFCDGTDMLFSAGSDSRIRIWDIVSAKELIYLSCSHSNITQIIVSHRRAYILACEESRYLSLWSLKMRSQIFLIEAHKEEITSIGIDEAEEFIFSAGVDGYIRIWDIPNGKCLANLEFSNPIKCATLISQGYLLYSGNNMWFQCYPLYRLRSSGRLAIKVISEKLLPVEYEPQPNAISEAIKEKLHNAMRNAAKILTDFRQQDPLREGSSEYIEELLKYEEYPCVDMLNVFAVNNEMMTVYFPKELAIVSSKFIFSYSPTTTNEKGKITAVVLSKDRDRLVYGTSGGSIYLISLPTFKDEILKCSDVYHKTGEITSICFIQTGKLAACSHKHVFFLLDIKSAKFLSVKNVTKGFGTKNSIAGRI